MNRLMDQDIEVIKIEFDNFLIENDIYDEYHYNRNHFFVEGENPIASQGNFLYDFMWEKTPEGIDFWSGIYSSWIRELTKFYYLTDELKKKVSNKNNRINKLINI